MILEDTTHFPTPPQLERIVRRASVFLKEHLSPDP